MAPSLLPASGRGGKGPEPSPLESCTLLTTEANDLVRPIHDRMPVIVAPADYALWLDPAVVDPQRLRRLLGPYPSREMAAYAVSTRINNPASEDRAASSRWADAVTVRRTRRVR